MIRAESEERDGEKTRGRCLGAVLLAAILVVAGLSGTGAGTVATDEEDLNVEVAMEPGRPFVDEEIDVGVLLENERDETVENVTVEVNLHQVRSLFDRSIGTLPPDEHAFVRGKVDPLAAGEHLIAAWANGTLSENSTDSGNVTGVDGETFLVTERNRSDLEPGQLSFRGEYADRDETTLDRIVEGERAFVAWTLENTGQGYPEESRGELSIDGERADEANFGRLFPQNRDVPHPHWVRSERVALERVQLPAGEHTLTVQADPDDTVDELDETNNQLARTVTVLPKSNPAVSEITAERSKVTVVGQKGPINPWAEREIAVTITNEGPGPTVQVAHIRAQVCPESGPLSAVPSDDDCRHLEDWEFAKTPSGDARTFTTEWDPAGQVGDYEICAQLDYARPQVTETDDQACKDTSVIVGNTGLGGT